MTSNDERRKVLIADADELAEIYSGPAVFANKIYVTKCGPNVRISFAELSQDGTMFFRSAVVLIISDASIIGDLIEAATGILMDKGNAQQR